MKAPLTTMGFSAIIITVERKEHMKMIVDMKIKADEWDGYYENNVSHQMAINLLNQMLITYQRSGNHFIEKALALAIEAMMREDNDNVETVEWHDVK